MILHSLWFEISLRSNWSKWNLQRSEFHFEFMWTVIMKFPYTKWNVTARWNFKPVWVHFASHVNVLLMQHRCCGIFFYNSFFFSGNAHAKQMLPLQRVFCQNNRSEVKVEWQSLYPNLCEHFQRNAMNQSEICNKSEISKRFELTLGLMSTSSKHIRKDIIKKQFCKSL